MTFIQTSGLVIGLVCLAALLILFGIGLYGLASLWVQLWWRDLNAEQRRNNLLLGLLCVGVVCGFLLYLFG